MTSADGQLESDTHSRIFEREILPGSGLNDSTSHEKPRAVILGGQPGSGKGRLVTTAMLEMSSDVVLVDPDELRKYHPDLLHFQQTHPLTWSSDTHADASAWSDKLLDATIDGKKNLIFDSTLSNGEWSSQLIKDLKSKGYAV